MNAKTNAPAGTAIPNRGEENTNTVTMPNAAPTVKIDEAANTSAAQRKRLLEVLRCQSISTFDARHKHDVMHPAARIMELRKQGYDIKTERVPELTPEGRAHNVARYFLRGLAE